MSLKAKLKQKKQKNKQKQEMGKVVRKKNIWKVTEKESWKIMKESNHKTFSNKLYSVSNFSDVNSQ